MPGLRFGLLQDACRSAYPMHDEEGLLNLLFGRNGTYTYLAMGLMGESRDRKVLVGAAQATDVWTYKHNSQLITKS
jgi:hypothetical protein